MNVLQNFYAHQVRHRRPQVNRRRIQAVYHIQRTVEFSRTPEEHSR